MQYSKNNKKDESIRGEYVFIYLFGCGEEENLVQEGEIVALEDLTLQHQEQINTLEQNCATKSELESVNQILTEYTTAIDGIIEEQEEQSQNYLTDEDIVHLASQESVTSLQDSVSSNQTSIGNLQSQIDTQNSSIASLQFETDST